MLPKRRRLVLLKRKDVSKRSKILIRRVRKRRRRLRVVRVVKVVGVIIVKVIVI